MLDRIKDKQRKNQNLRRLLWSKWWVNKLYTNRNSTLG